MEKSKSEMHRNFFRRDGRSKYYFYGMILVAITLAIAYYFLPPQYPDGIVLGRNKLLKLAVFFVSSSLLFLSLSMPGAFILKNDKMLMKVLSLSALLIAVYGMNAAVWSYDRIENGELSTRYRLLPLKNAMELNSRRTIALADVARLRFDSGGGDSGASLILYSDNGVRKALPIGNIPADQLARLYRTIYEECAWLRDDLERDAGYPLSSQFPDQRSFRPNPDGIVIAVCSLMFWLLLLGVRISLTAISEKINVLRAGGNSGKP